MKTFVYVLEEVDGAKQSSILGVHASEAAAQAEKTRLAAKNPCMDYCVWERELSGSQDVQAELARIVAAKKGDKSLALFFHPGTSTWQLDLGNPSPVVQLGEAAGEVSVEGPTLAEVIAKMKRQLGA